MRLLCREDHTEHGDIEVERDLSDELRQAKAKLAKLKRLPLSAFVEKSHRAIRYTPFGPMTYAVDNKDDTIARAEANIAELKALRQQVKEDVNE